jgi:hypothetical protein
MQVRLDNQNAVHKSHRVDVLEHEGEHTTTNFVIESGCLQVITKENHEGGRTITKLYHLKDLAAFREGEGGIVMNETAIWPHFQEGPVERPTT